MTTLLDNTGLPLWVYIVLIVVGSMLLLATLAILLRCWFVRRKPKQSYIEGLTGPTRRVTLRRGRLVPTSQHLSLTGSKFGTRQFGMLADNESTMTGRRSPFEWWNTIMDRSQSRQDQMSQVETGSISASTRPTSRATTTAGRREVLTATPTLTPEKYKEPVSRTWEVTLPSQSPSPPPSPSPSPYGQKTVNFSRSFVSRTPSSPLAQRSQHTLSRISEKSLHYSMISTNGANGTNQLSPSSYHATVGSISGRSPLFEQPLRNSPTPANSMSLAIPVSPAKPSPTLAGEQFNHSAVMKPRPWASDRLSASATSLPQPAPSPTVPSRPFTADASLSRDHPYLIAPSAVPTLTVPKPVVYGTSKPGTSETYSHYNQPNLSQLDLSRESIVLSGRDSISAAISDSHLAKQPPANISVEPNLIVYDTQLPEYWSQRPGMPDLASSLNINGSTAMHSREHAGLSEGIRNEDGEEQNRLGIMTVPGKKKSKVLRKKSLRRMQTQATT
ncbi:hypothetical protein A1O3_06662 [Capronia epimyces CBS 606.96]|uniref:Uncharacterized protein n=1 Tax=Capronia epimyces CBS 606.96 TaxID=1182542 RepID=W9XQQ5_9EURO|nr:uncharacterized protein A1O3_06662 [Capronia epimyces CBS 606.96]EXJ82847.1 hypothetical protein A1O3_06662 [Capronia epimyces CBS 606.96]